MSLKDIAAARQISEMLEGKTFPTTTEEVEEFAKKTGVVKDPKFEKLHPRSADGKFGKKSAPAPKEYKPTDKNDRWMGEWPNIEQSKIVKEVIKHKGEPDETVWSTEFQSPKDPTKKLRVSVRDKGSSMSDEGKKMP